MAFVLVPIFWGTLEAIGAITTAVESGIVAGETLGVGASIGSNVTRAGLGAAVTALANTTSQSIKETFGNSTSEPAKDIVNASEQDWKEAWDALFMNKQQLEEYKQKTKQKKEDARRYQEALNARQREIDTNNQFAIDFYRRGYDNTQPYQDLFELELNPQFFNQVSKINPFNTTRAEQVEKAKRIGSDLADFLIDDLSKNLGSTPQEALDNLDTKHPLSESILAYALSIDVRDFIPTDDLYKQISQVYDGRRIVKESVFKEPRNDGSGLNIYAGYEEDGNPAVYYEHSDGIKIRPIWPGHVWTGIFSPNSDLPHDLWDAFSFFHDASYQEFGWFDRVGDYKYISRLVNNFDRFPEVQKPMIRNTIRYFSSIGTALSYFNNRPVNVPTQDQVNQQFEQFNQQQSTPHFINFIDSNIDVNAEIIKVFNDTIKEKLINESSNIIQAATMNDQAGGSVMNDGVGMMLDYEVLRNLDVELIINLPS